MQCRPEIPGFGPAYANALSKGRDVASSPEDFADTRVTFSVFVVDLSGNY